ncbi:MAG: M24 family metallopeptidase [Acidobacteriota bacterium]
MTIRARDELTALEAAGRVVAKALAAMKAAVRPGVTTGELDAIAAGVFATAPSVPNFDDPLANRRLEEGMVIAVEPIVAAGSGGSYLARDGWTIRTADCALAAHHEHTIVITRGRPIVLTRS